MSVTIKDVAKQAGVATSTVSRVLSDSPKISEKTKRRVRKVMEEMGYYLNENARNLVQQSTKTIGIVMKHSTSQSMHDPFFPEVLRGISSYCHKQDFGISLTTGDSEEAIFQDVIKMVQGKKVDGLIVSYSKKGDKVVPYLIKSGIPFVVVGKPIVQQNQIIYVDNDNVQASKDATEYLLQLGHQRIGLIGGNRDYEVAESRLNGFLQAHRIRGMEVSDHYIKNPKSPGLVKQAVREIMNLSKPPTSLVVTDDFSAMNVLQVMREIGIKVPEQLSIVSFNNTSICELSSPPLTSVDTQIYQLGYESARCLIDEVKEPSEVKRSIIIPTFIKERESSSVVPKY
ncbi:LacI family DNA-binding transcriptional regulator [Aquibacillus kalidii]|uniref:LacI family DNA-binding transcriptional regulator n=1 Tax=Aquibacillus kalidii TaxID=2762597 RepID=UPI001648E183|nr:LacI family DNA-binding transcriptional regulator [Aquibacillus kalidii]